MNRLIGDIKNFLDSRGMLQAEGRLAVAWSGGADSTFLMWAIRELERSGHTRCLGIHVHHGIRDSSDLEEEKVRAISERIGVELEVVRLSLSRGPGLQERAREARYAALEMVARRKKCLGILTGHSFDDQAETVIMRLLRGAQVRGLRGILPHTERTWLRPMLQIRHKEAVDTLNELSIPFIEDPSNTDRRFLRVRVRTEILPLLEIHNPEIRQRLVKISSQAQRLWESGIQHLDGISPSAALPISKLLNMPSFLQGAALEKWLGHSLESKHIERILTLATKPDGKSQSAPGAHTIHRVGTYLVPGPRCGSPDLERAFSSIMALGQSALHCAIPDGAPKSARWLPANLLPPSAPKNRRWIKEALRKKKVSPILRPIWPILVHKSDVLGIAGIGATPIPTKEGCKR